MVVLDVLDMLEAMRCVLLYMLEAAEGELRSPEVVDVVDVPEVIRCVLLYTLEAVEGATCASYDGGHGGRLRSPEALEVPEVPEVMRFVLLRTPRRRRVGSRRRRCWRRWRCRR